MDLNLDGTIAFITGGSKGIGFACAVAFARRAPKSPSALVRRTISTGRS